MTDDDVLDAFRRIRCWEREGERAPHKPLLLLMALASLQRGESPGLSFEDIEEPLKNLLREFGPARKSYQPEYPFWWLKSDGLWVIDDVERLQGIERKRKNLPATVLRAEHARGALAPEIVARLKARPSLVNEVATILLEQTFPASLHDDILDAVGFPWIVEADRPLRRDPAFRDAILRIYERRCAVCGYDGRLGSSELGLEAAHVKWHAAGGPDTLDNGLALCVFHHKAVDRGAIGLDDERRIIVSQDVNGQSHVDDLILRFVGQPLRPPQAGQPGPAVPFIQWHRSEVFRPPARA